MKELSDWLKQVEHTACDIYKEASQYFKGNEKLQTFLKYLSNDEAWHYHLMGSASDCFSQNDIPADISLDVESRQAIEGLFDEMRVQITEGSLTEEMALKLVARAEFSEWNDIFLYVVQNLTCRNYEFSFALSKIQQHMKYIEENLLSFSQYPSLADEFKNIHPVWEKRILLVEDTETLITLLAAVLKREGLVEVARNGEEALKIIKNIPFDLIISDIQMPVMDGIALFKRVESEHPELISRYIFHTSAPTGDVNAFIEKYSIPLATKPSSLARIRRMVRDMLGRAD